MTNCPNCGAPVQGAVCEYCGTHFVDYSHIDPGKSTQMIKLGNHLFEAYVAEFDVFYNSIYDLAYRDIEGRLHISDKKIIPEITLRLIAKEPIK